ncbi:MAG: Rrf2 family transcriptional regulator [Bacteroidales bacterium]|nr:Rrf2 family transcriptional regulator [Bacteroidales bacterium]
MLSNSCRYGIRAMIYIASRQKGDSKTGIQQISKDLNLPTPFLAKILQQLARQKMLKSLKGPHGGFSLIKDPSEITLYDIVKVIDGEDLFTNCIIHNASCSSVERKKMPCPVHKKYSEVRSNLIKLFKTVTVEELVKNTVDSEKILI